MDTYLIGLDIAKNVFTAHAIDRTGKPLFRKKLSRSELLPFFASISVSTIAMEACGGAHHWARKFQELGHQTQLLPAQHVKPFLRGQKNDMRDAQAIAEAALMPTMHRVPTKSVEQQTILSLHRLRTGWVEERTALSNRIRGLLAEFGIAISQGLSVLRNKLPRILQESDLPVLLRTGIERCRLHFLALDAEIAQVESDIQSWHLQHEQSKRLADIPGIGMLTATQIVALIGNGAQFRNGRHFAAWVGLVPRQYSTGGVTRLGRISKRGSIHLRSLLIHGACTVIRWLIQKSEAKTSGRYRWILKLLKRMHPNKVAVALANKQARTVWNMLHYNTRYHDPDVLAA
jgi:transposase